MKEKNASLPDLLGGDSLPERSENNPGKRGEGRQGKALSEVQKLLEQIAEARESGLKIAEACDQALLRMNAAIARYQERAKQIRLAYFHALGRFLRSDALKKRQKDKLLEGLFHLACMLEEENEADVWDELCRYSGKPREYFLDDEEEGDLVDFESLFQAFQQHQKARGANPEGFSDRDQDRDGDESADAAKPDGFTGTDEDQMPRRSHKKSKSKKPEAKAESQQASLLGDIRTLYLMLARALHPDKESDDTRRSEKTAWMQKVTAAYSAKNLGDLLDILARNPLNALGPYLEATPEATLRGFAKRLRREWQGLTRQAQDIFRRYPPDVARMVTRGNFHEPAFKGWEKGLKNHLDALKHRARIYQDLGGVLILLDSARDHEWELLL